MQLSRSDGLEININKSNLLIDILTKNTSPDLEIGLLIQHDMGDALLNIKDSEVTINNLYDGENTTVSGIKKNGLYLYGTKVTVNNSFMNINTDNIFGSAYYNDRAVTGDKFTITPSDYKIKTDAILYDYNNTQILLNNNDLTKEDFVKVDMMGYSNPTLLIDLDSYTYDIIDGNKQEIIKNDNKEYSFKIDGNDGLCPKRQISPFKVTSMKKQNYNNPRRREESEHDELVRLRAENAYIKAEIDRQNEKPVIKEI